MKEKAVIRVVTVLTLVLVVLASCPMTNAKPHIPTRNEVAVLYFQDLYTFGRLCMRYGQDYDLEVRAGVTYFPQAPQAVNYCFQAEQVGWASFGGNTDLANIRASLPLQIRSSTLFVQLGRAWNEATSDFLQGCGTLTAGPVPIASDTVNILAWLDQGVADYAKVRRLQRQIVKAWHLTAIPLL